MFYSNEVYISNICSARELENKDARFSNTSIDDMIRGSRPLTKQIENAWFIRIGYSLLKYRLFKIIDVVDYENSAESISSIEKRPNLILESIYGESVVIARARDVLFCTAPPPIEIAHADNIRSRLPSIFRDKDNTSFERWWYATPWCRNGLLKRDQESMFEYLSADYISRASYVDAYHTTYKIWKDKLFVDRLDSRVSNPNRFYLDSKTNRFLNFLKRHEPLEAEKYVHCTYCSKVVSEFENIPTIGEVCLGCYTEVEIPCGICLGTDTISNINSSKEYDSRLNAILDSLGIEKSHRRCAHRVHKECDRCSILETIDIDKLHSMETLADRKQYLASFHRNGYGETYHAIDGDNLCTNCAELSLNSRLFSPYRGRTLPKMRSKHKDYTRHIGIESEVITHYEDVEDYQENAWCPDNFEVVPDGSLGSGGVEFRTDRPLISSLVDKSLDELEQVHRDEDNQVDTDCGLHIHINAIDFGFRELKSLLMLTSSIQKTIYKSLPQSRVTNSYAKPIELNPVEIAQIKDLPSLVRSYYAMSGDSFDSSRYNDARYVGTNLHARFFLGTIEFRYHEGEIYSKNIKRWIKFLNRIMDTSKDLHRNTKLYQKVLSSSSNEMDIIHSIGGAESTEYIEERINDNR